ncbi:MULTISPECIES: hypothetical protein [unclassified Variovorax]|uniref:hypothetical protein n=1 Tax=unclassified Variovorax TaxID=663243 RepID=UPI0013A54E79|nr:MULTISPECIES: hypothetical protein [unclassified Variovorax]
MRIAILLMAPGVHCAAHAADGGTGTWRCGNTYTDQPCKNGKVVGLDDARDAAQKRAADGTTREARSAADRLERDRLRQESEQAKRQPVLIEDRPDAKPRQESRTGARKSRKGQSGADYFSVRAPASTAKKKTAKAAGRKSAPQG